MPQIVIDPRFKGPPESANGGYACGRLARLIDGTAEVTLRSPPPLDRPMETREEENGASLWDGETLVATAKPSPGGFDAPPPVGLDEARAATDAYVWMEDHPYPECFVCGPARDPGDGLRIFPGQLERRDLFASPWTPTADLAGEDGLVSPEFIWSALDCPSGVAVNAFGDVGMMLLGRLSVEIHRPARAGEHYVLTAAPRSRDGRKLHTASALYTESGDLLASAEAVWIELAPSS